ncbi:MAG: CbtA family protein [Alphaproteobacteria bacterium]|nr:CbtA family protein [Alphaproteobacteria bacterium]
MITRTLLTGLLAGLAAGIVLTLLYIGKIQPLILAAEGYEHGADPELSAPLKRLFDTFLFNILNGVGFGFLLAAILTARDRPTGIQHGVLWGIAGYVAFVLAPAAGLPPELPGSISAPLEARQFWWLFTAVTTAGGLWLMALRSHRMLKGIGVILLLLPHIVGAPHADAYGEMLPAELAAEYVGVTLGAMALFWAVLGGVAGWGHDHFSDEAKAEVAA